MKITEGYMPFVEDNDHYCRVLGEWLDEND